MLPKQHCIINKRGVGISAHSASFSFLHMSSKEPKSVVCITVHDENVRDFAVEKIPKSRTCPIYKSKHKDNVVCEYKQKYWKHKTQHATMGLAEYPKENPCCFLKKQSRPSTAFLEAQPHCLKESKLPSIPHVKDTRNTKACQTEKNFLFENVKYVAEKGINKLFKKYAVFNERGDKEDAYGVLEPRYIYSAKFGKTPIYLRKIKIQNGENKPKTEISDAAAKICHCISSEERNKILSGLKHNFEELQKQYQKLPIFTDTLPKINRKNKLEADLRQLEKDIELIEKHPCIYVYNNE